MSVILHTYIEDGLLIEHKLCTHEAHAGCVGSPVRSPQCHTVATIDNANIGYILFSDLHGLVPISAHLVPVYKSRMNVLRYDTNLLGCRTSVGCCATVIGHNRL